MFNCEQKSAFTSCFEFLKTALYENNLLSRLLTTISPNYYV